MSNEGFKVPQDVYNTLEELCKVNGMLNAILDKERKKLEEEDGGEEEVEKFIKPLEAAILELSDVIESTCQYASSKVADNVLFQLMEEFNK